jgi:predicted alpha/beta superfamily hydrolase
VSDPYEPIMLPGTEIRRIHSNIVDEDYRLYVYLPWGYNETDQAYPVLYFTDANLVFLRSLWSTPLPDVLLVGIGYDTDDYVAQIRLRARDFLPTRNERDEREFKEMSGIEIESGGGEAFLSFLHEELFPFVESQYRIIPGNRAYFGQSYGGTFGAYTLFTRPDTFSRYVLASPELTWDNERCFAYEREYAETHDDLPVKLYLAAGTFDESTQRPFVSNLVKLHQILKEREYPGLDLRYDLLDREYHVTSVIPAAQFGARFIYDVD